MPNRQMSSRPTLETRTGDSGEKCRTKREIACPKSRVWGVYKNECHACQGECQNPQIALALAPPPKDKKPREAQEAKRQKDQLVPVGKPTRDPTPRGSSGRHLFPAPTRPILNVR